MRDKKRPESFNNNKGDGKVKENVKFHHDPMVLTYGENFEKMWSFLPDSIGKVIATIATFVVGISINGK